MPHVRSIVRRTALATVAAAAAGAGLPAVATGATQAPVKVDGVGMAASLPGAGSFGLYRFDLSRASGGAQPTAWVVPFREASNGAHTKYGHCIELEQTATATAAARLRSGDHLALDNPGANTIPPGDDDVRVAQLEWLLASSYAHRADADYANGIAAAAHQSAVWKITNPSSAGNDLGTATPARAQADAMADALLAKAVAHAGAMDPATWSLTVSGGTTPTCAGSTRTLTVKGSPNTTATLTITAGSATFANGAKTLDVFLGDDGTVQVPLVDVGTGADTVTVRASLPDWILAQADNGANQDFAYLIAGTPVVKTVSVSFAPCAQLGLEATAAASFTRRYAWTVEKTAGTPSVSGRSATIPYRITVARDGGSDSAFVVSGEARLTNPNAAAVSAMVGATLPGATCTTGAGVTVPGNATVAVAYTCILPSRPAGAVAPVVQAQWGSGSASATPAGVAFGAPSSVLHPSVQVVDAYAGGPGEVIGTCAEASCSYDLQRTAMVPESGCADVVNTAVVVDGGETLGSSTVTTKLCYSSTTTVGGGPTTPLDAGSVTTGGNTATLTLTKRAARSWAAAGGKIRFTLAVRNTGTVPARNVQVCDRLPGTMVFLSVPKAKMRKGQACFTARSLKPGARATFTVVARVLGTVGVGRTCNTATASAGNASSTIAKVCIATRPRTVNVTGRIVGVTG